MPKKGYRHSEEAKKKMSLSRIGKHHTVETKEKMSLAHKGKHHSEEAKRKIGEFNKGKVISEEHKRKMSLANKGHKAWNKGIPHSEEARRKMSLAHKVKYGAENNHWKGGITPLSSMIRTSSEYSNWRIKVYQRDYYTCQECFEKSGSIEAHHYIKRFSIILKEFLREYNQFSPIEDREILSRIAINYKPFWDVDNGETLCEDCHNETKGRLKKREGK